MAKKTVWPSLSPWETTKRPLTAPKKLENDPVGLTDWLHKTAISVARQKRKATGTIGHDKLVTVPGGYVMCIPPGLLVDQIEERLALMPIKFV